jgi:hypothetical protein
MVRQLKGGGAVFFGTGIEDGLPNPSLITSPGKIAGLQ